MKPEKNASTDKFIVDRRRAPRSGEVWDAVKRTRVRLSHGGSDPRYDREMLLLHARAMASSAVAIPLLVLLTATAMLFFGFGQDALLWAVVTTTAFLILAILAKRLEARDGQDFSVALWQRRLLLAHFATGLGWAYFTLLACDDCGEFQMPVIKAVILLVAMAAGAIVSYSLLWALPAAFALPVLIFALQAFSLRDPLVFGLAGTLLAALPFFMFVSSRLNSAAVQQFTYRTEMDALVAELETARAMSEEARRRAEDANLAKSRFLASMSHELRTPLNAILGFSEVMAQEVLGPIENPSYLDYARDIHQSGAHLLNLINEILDLSRIEAGKYQLNEEALRLSDVAEDCVNMVRLRARNKDIRISEQFETALSPIWADERSVRQVILNLLSNAVKFTPRGGEVVVKCGWTAGGGQYVSIRDNGPGIPEDEIPVVLSAFGQGSIAIKNAEQGTGLGLPIVQALMAMHGGTFKLRSKMREGTEAIAVFPQARVGKARVEGDTTTLNAAAA